MSLQRRLSSKVPLYKHTDMSLDPNSQVKMQALGHRTVVLHQGVGDRWIPGVQWPAGQAESIISRFQMARDYRRHLKLTYALHTNTFVA